MRERERERDRQTDRQTDSQRGGMEGAIHVLLIHSIFVVALLFSFFSLLYVM